MTPDQCNHFIAEHFQGASVQFLDEMTLQCQGVLLQLTRGLDKQPSSNDVVSLFKGPRFLHSYMECLAGSEVENMVEVGVRDGGSAIFFWNLLRPRRLCCIELSSGAPALDHYKKDQDLHSSLHTCFGVDQSDREEMVKVVDTTFADQTLDLVIDDASHLYGPSRVTFETLFPRLRPGGLYILEDWKASLLVRHRDGVSVDEPLHQLVHELLEVSLYHPGIIASINCLHHFVVVKRGPEELDSEQLALQIGTAP